MFEYVFLFILNNIPLYEYAIFYPYIHLWTFGLFLFWAIMNNSPRNLNAQDFM